MTPELLNKLKHLANIAAHLPADVTLEDEDAALKALHGELAADTVLELIALAERSLSVQDEVLTDQRIIEICAREFNEMYQQISDSWIVAFARALLAAAPAPIQQEPVAFIVKLKGNPHKVLCWPDMGPRKRQSANLEYTPLYATPPALAGSQVQAADDARDAARYRWLRERRDIPHGSRNIPWVVALDPEEKIHTMILRAGIDLDHAIDAAMREQP